MNDSAPAIARRRITIGGNVQGVGFRPCVYRLATRHNLSGWIANTRSGVAIEIEGNAAAIDVFLSTLHTDAPARARIESLHSETLPVIGANDFRILDEDSTDAIQKNVAQLSLPLDLAICERCRAELFDPTNRRYRHPFIACCDCGPRWSALAALPWQRNNTALANFATCTECDAEYSDPDDRRFHAQNNCCPHCGPQLAFRNPDGSALTERNEALRKTVDALRDGAVVAVKGLGGFHLMVDARNADAIARLRERKNRPHKPLAVMFETLEQLERYCDCDPAERELLTSAAAPIVLLRSRGKLPDSVAPGNPYLGAMLAYTPLYLLLLRDAGFPLIATSGNRSGEPICFDETLAREQLGDIADYFLAHDRPILQPIDDSVAQIAAGGPMLLRCARGYAPLDLPMPRSSDENYLALGGQLKSTVALSDGERVLVSPHIGNLGSVAGDLALEHAVENLQSIAAVHAARIVCDAHPDYRSTHVAHALSADPIHIQHHHAHVAAVMAEHELNTEVLGIAWDGSGLGDDGTLWGGEFLRATRAGYTRIATLRNFALPGGEAAAREPRRVALSLLYDMSDGDLERYADLPALQSFSANELAVLQGMLAHDVNCPRNSSIGRLFDGVAALLGLCTVASFEGQAAMALQFAAERHTGAAEPFGFTIDERDTPNRIDWAPLLTDIITSIREGSPPEAIAARFHITLAAIAAAIAKHTDYTRIVLAGGCFQNRQLLEKTIAALQQINREVFWPHRLPPNDGALAFGQIAIARAQCASHTL